MTKYIEKLILLDEQIDHPIIHQQVQEIKTIIRQIDQGKVLKKAPEQLGIEPDEVEEISQISNQPNFTKKVVVVNKLLNSFRQYISLKYGIWSLPNLETAKKIKDELKINSALEIMAGNAYWSKALSEVGIDVIATDNLEWAKTSSTGTKQFMHVENLSAMGAIDAYPKTDIIFCSWAPNFGIQDIELISKWQKFCHNRLLFVGEKDGVTNSPEFWHNVKFKYSEELTNINLSFHSFDFINEKIFEIGNLNKYELEKN